MKRSHKLSVAPAVPVRTTSLSSSQSRTPSPPPHQRSVTSSTSIRSTSTSSSSSEMLSPSKRKTSSATIQTNRHAYLESLLSLQQKGYEEIKSKWCNMDREVEIKKSDVMMKEKQMYRNLIRGSSCKHDSSQVDNLIRHNDDNRLMKAEIAGLLHQLWYNGYEGPLGYFPDGDIVLSKEHTCSPIPFRSHPQESYDPPPLPPRSQKSCEAPKFGMIYSRVPPSPTSPMYLAAQRPPVRRVSESAKPPALPPKPDSYKRTISQNPSVQKRDH